MVHTRHSLALDIERAGIRAGDTVTLHSSYRAIGEVRGGPQAVVDAFLDVLGPSGTLSTPAFTPSFYATRRYDHDRMPPEECVIAREVWSRPGRKRTLHPGGSVSFFGGEAEAYAACFDRLPFGMFSCYARMEERGAKIAAIGSYENVDMPTVYHYFEIKYNVPYRSLKAFPGAIIVDGAAYEDTFYHPVRDLEIGVINFFAKANRRMDRAGAYDHARIGDAQAYIVSIPRAWRYFRRLMDQDIFLLVDVDIEKARAKFGGIQGIRMPDIPEEDRPGPEFLSRHPR